MNRPQVFIPSRGRPNNATKLDRAWHKEGFDTNWVVEPDEAKHYANRLLPYDEGQYTHTKVIPLPAKNQGIAYSRNFCVNLAADDYLDVIVMADDDIKPSNNCANMQTLVQAAMHPKVLGITARYSYHDLCLGAELKNHLGKLILLPTGTFRLVALNVRNVMDIGNYDHTLEYAEDCDLLLRGLQDGYPWLLHAGTWANSIGTRYQPGGMIDFATDTGGSLATRKAEWHKTLYAQYPDFVNEHTDKCKGKQNCIRISWRKAYDTLIPDWRKYSDLHGGALEAYLNA